MAQLFIADDMAISRETLARVLRDAGHRVTSCTSGEEVLDRARGDMPDLALLDYNMQGINGAQTAAALKALGSAAGVPLLPVIILSGRTINGHEFTELLQIVDDFVRKPYTPSEVCARVDVWLRVRRMVQGAPEEARRSAVPSPAPIPVPLPVSVQFSGPTRPSSGSGPASNPGVPDDGVRVRGRADLLRRLEDLWQRGLRGSEPFALMLIELYAEVQTAAAISSSGGEGPLQGVARALARLVRQSDLLGQVAPGQLGVMLPGATLTGALTAAERLRGELRLLHQRRLLPGPVVLGVALFPARDAANADDLLRAAERAAARARDEAPFSLCIHQHQGYMVRAP